MTGISNEERKSANLVLILFKLDASNDSFYG